jgi:regulator of replication initiation timing
MNTIRPLSLSLQNKAYIDLNEIPQNIPSELEELRKLILEVPHLRSRLDDQFLIGFLRNCKHNVEDTLRKIISFYSCRSSLPELMENRDPANQRIREILKLGVGIPLPFTQTPDSPRVILIRVGAYESTEYSIIDIMKVANMICDVLL